MLNPPLSARVRIPTQHSLTAKGQDTDFPQQALNRVLALPNRPPLSLLPPSQRSGINSQAPGHLLLRESPDLPVQNRLFGQGWGWWEWVVAQELDDRLPVLANWGGGVALPIPDRRLVHAGLLGDVLLKEIQVQPSVAKVIT
jgi:hypothetical protein